MAFICTVNYTKKMYQSLLYTCTTSTVLFISSGFRFLYKAAFLIWMDDMNGFHSGNLAALFKDVGWNSQEWNSVSLKLAAVLFCHSKFSLSACNNVNSDKTTQWLPSGIKPRDRLSLLFKQAMVGFELRQGFYDLGTKCQI